MNENGSGDNGNELENKKSRAVRNSTKADGTDPSLLDEAERLQRLESLSLVTGGIAHDINNILTSILGNVALAKRRSSSEDDRELLRDVEKACIRATDLTYQLLSLCKGGTLFKDTATIADLIRDSARFSLRGSNLKCEMDIPSDLCHVSLDIGRISRVISNVVINARHAMPEGGIISVKGENLKLLEENSAGLPQGDYVLISIRDHGPGIHQEHLHHIFRPYYTTKPEGSGLGLSTALSVVRDHGGTITVHSEEGSGSTFYIYLPASAEHACKDVPENNFNHGSGRVLVLDDDNEVRKIAALILKELGYEPFCVSDEKSALRALEDFARQGNPFDAAVIDLTIPGEAGGKSTVKKLRQVTPDLKTLVASGYFEDPAMTEPEKHGFDGSIRKPFTIEEMGKVLSGVMKKKQ